MKSFFNIVIDFLVILVVTLGLGALTVVGITGIAGVVLHGNVYLIGFLDRYVTNGLEFMEIFWVVTLIAFTIDVVIRSYKSFNKHREEVSDNDSK